MCERILAQTALAWEARSAFANGVSRACSAGCQPHGSIFSLRSSFHFLLALRRLHIWLLEDTRARSDQITFKQRLPACFFGGVSVRGDQSG